MKRTTKDVCVLEENIRWNTRDAILVFVATLLFTAIIALLFLPFVSRCPYVFAAAGALFNICAVLFLLKRRGAGLMSVGLRSNNGSVVWRSIWSGFFAGFVLWMGYVLILHPLHSKSVIESIIDARQVLGSVAKAIVLMTTLRGFVSVLLGPVSEELLFRGLLFQALLKKRNMVVSVVLVSALHIFVHPSFWFQWRLLLLFVLFNTSATIWYAKTRDLFVCIAFHASINLFLWIAAMNDAAQGVNY